MKSSLLILLIFLGLSLYAQEPEELWSGTATVRVSTSANLVLGQQNKRILYRSVQTDQENALNISESSIGTMVFNDHRLTGYADIGLMHQLTDEEIDSIYFGIDTIRFNDSHYREIPCVLVARKPEPEHYHLVDFHLQVSYFSDGTVEQYVGAVSLSDGDEYSDLPPVYLSVELLLKELQLDQTGWNAVNRIAFHIPFDSLTTQSTAKLPLPEALKHLTKHVLKTKGTEFSNVSDWGEFGSYELNKMVELEGDTTVYIDPITYESTVYPNSTPPMHEHANKLRLYQLWAWDDKAARLVISPIGYAPERSELDENGTWLFDWSFTNWAHPWYRKNQE